MTKARNIADLLDANGDVVSGALDNVPASNDASALTTGTIDNARISLDANEIPNLDTAKITTGTFSDARMPSTVLNSNVDLTNLSATNLTSGTVPIARLGTSGTKDATTFLRGDNTFAAPAAAGVSNSFQAVGSGGETTFSGALAVPTEIHDDGGNYDTANGRYTAPSTGYYLFFASALISGTAGTSFYFTKNGSAVSATNVWGYNGLGNQNQLNTYAILSLSSGDYVNIYSDTTVYKHIYLNFGGCKLY